MSVQSIKKNIIRHFNLSGAGDFKYYWTDHRGFWERKIRDAGLESDRALVQIEESLKRDGLL